MKVICQEQNTFSIRLEAETLAEAGLLARLGTMGNKTRVIFAVFAGIDTIRASIHVRKKRNWSSEIRPS